MCGNIHENLKLKISVNPQIKIKGSLFDLNHISTGSIKQINNYTHIKKYLYKYTYKNQSND